MALPCSSPRRWRARPIALAAVSAAIGAACAAPMPAPDAPFAADAYRAEIASEPKGDRAKVARAALERSEAEKAKREHTILGYRRFLAEFPSGPFAVELRARLEGLRWVEAEKAGTEAALSGFLFDEPAGAHAAEAWEKLASVQLQAALGAGSEEKLRAWLQAHPQSAGRERALLALDEAQFAAALKADSEQAEALRRYLAERPEGAHRAQAQELLRQREVEDAALIEDDARLSALARQGAGAAVAKAEAGLELARAEARLDREALARIAEGGGQGAVEARQVLEQLEGVAVEELAGAASELFLPRPTGDDLPAGAAARAAALQAWALALDGRRLPALLAEVRSARSFVALAALRSAGELLAGLPRGEAKAPAAALAAALRPRAQAAALLVELSVLEEAAGRPAVALAEARAAMGRDKALVAAVRAAQLEARVGEPAVALLAAQALAAQAGAQGELHLEAAVGSDERRPDGLALLELCASSQAAREAVRLLASDALANESGVAEAREHAARVAGKLGARLDEAERGVADRAFASCKDREAAAVAEARAAVERRVQAVKKLAGSPPAAAALERARRRDPAVEVQQALGPAAARASAAPLR